ncbi:L,D-transpeptidase [Candidatus Microgenomates bacterium]|nr:L,D-transpeptidase [Candidatus Microgenomates bacterium]MBI2622391.1 L,D-transpeptidase [Candidatus Microgenomates bacterium]
MRGKLSSLHLVALMLGVFILFSFWQNSPVSDKLCANSISCIKDLSGAAQIGETQAVFHSAPFTVPDFLARKPAKNEAVLGASNVYKRIQVDLTNQRLYAYEGDQLVYEFPVSTGKWAPTPTGTFKIWVKLKRTKMEGGNKAISTYYYLPNVPNVMYFYNDETPKSRGFGLHGAYWHNNFGHPMSHGCVNLPLDWAEKLFAWADPVGDSNATYTSEDNPGTRIIIYGQAPKE